ncbi:MAG: GHKL domain-containing protein [Ruminococcus flavefaciens]|nr:GHKL domain-containing protein [Roseburia sp.]MCM1234459.1 GHKL domain-containing protein [Ruminococcus flavefaciens]
MFEVMRNVLLIFIEAMCCGIFFETFGEIRHKGWINVIQILLLLGSMCIYSYVLSEYFVPRQIIAISVFSVFMLWHVIISLKKSIVLAVLYDALILTTDYLIYSVNRWFFLSSKMLEQQYQVGLVLVSLLAKIILFLFILIIRKWFGKKSMEMMQDTEWLRFLFFPVFTIAAISAMLSIFEYVQTVEQANLLAVIAFGMVGMNIVVFYLINDILEREMKIHESKVFQIQAKNQLEMYQSISDNFDKQKRKTHEYKNQISCIESLLDKKQYSKLEEYVKKIYGSLNNEPDAINTNNVIVNAILNTKYQEAEAKGIVFVFRVNDLSELKIKDEDVVTILANLLNNAIEACETCEDKKVIKFKFVKEDDMIIIAVKNTFHYDVVYENGEIKSTKTSGGDEHGVGIKNVLKIIEKYGGEYVIEDKNKEFSFSIIIPV